MNKTNYQSAVVCIHGMLIANKIDNFFAFLYGITCYDETEIQSEIVKKIYLFFSVVVTTSKPYSG